MRNDRSDAVKRDAVPSAGRGKVWLQRFAGIVLGGLAGAGAAYSTEIWSVVRESAIVSPAERTGTPEPQHAATIPAIDAAESARQMAHALATRARDLIVRGEIREAERFIAAAETLEPNSAVLAETRRLLDIAKAKVELAKSAPATGKPERASPQPAAAAEPTPAAEFAAGVKEFRDKNYNAALAHFGKAAAAGHAPAQNYLGYMYRHGYGVGQDYAKALAWYHKAAAQNHAGASNNIGYMYRHGLGVGQDYAEARNWFRRAAERGDPAGQYNLAQMLADGVGADADYREALKWFKSAADQGHARSAMGMAHLYAQGLGVTADPAEAYFWYGVAARSGVEGAQRFRTAIGAQLTADQRQTADGRLARWHAQSAERETR